jgi:hypothetical protein
MANQVQVDLASLLRTIHATTTAPAKRRELWDLALNLLASHLEVYGIASSVQLQPLVRRKALAYSFLDSLPYTGRSEMSTSGSGSSLNPPAGAAGPSKSTGLP